LLHRILVLGNFLPQILHTPMVARKLNNSTLVSAILINVRTYSNTNCHSTSQDLTHSNRHLLSFKTTRRLHKTSLSLRLSPSTQGF